MMLFNLDTDEAEQQNVAEQNPEIVSKMAERVESWWVCKDSGYRSPQWNVPWPYTANPRWHNWTWAPFWHLEGEAPPEELQALIV